MSAEPVREDAVTSSAAESMAAPSTVPARGDAPVAPDALVRPDVPATAFDPEAARAAWFPICAVDDLPFRHVFHARLLGRELAVWRADDGQVNVWENRCLHRGVRLSMGINDGAELVCRYHGWRYASRSAGCTYIPAHPANAPARRICNRVFPVRERGGLVWSGESPLGEPGDIDGFEGEDTLVLRAVPVNASFERVRTMLTEAVDAPEALREHGEEDGVVVASRWFLQPLAADRTVIRGLVRLPDGWKAGLDPQERTARTLALLRVRDRSLDALRRRIEAEARLEPAPEPFRVTPTRVSEALAELPEASASGRAAPLRLQVTARRELARDIVGFDFVAVADGTTEAPPTAAPGSHVDLHLPDGLVRQYSLTGGPDESERWSIAVQREPDSRGGSAWLHERLRVGDVLAASVPHNGFALRRDASDTLLVAGGIGITALVSMAKALHRAALPFELLHFARDAGRFAFGEALDAMGGRVERLAGRSPGQTRARVAAALGTHAPGRHVYVCGPPALIDAVRTLAAAGGWPDESVHVEHFGNARPLSRDGAFEVALARSGVTLPVAAGETILEALRAHGMPMPSSCEQGACGTCRVDVVDGVPEHQDVYLSEAEKAAGRCMMVCVSRARGERLVLDL